MRIGLWLAASALLSACLIAFVAATPAFVENRARKIEVYQAFVSAYAEDEPINLANRTTLFSASNDAVLGCAPTVLATTAIVRHFRTVRLSQADFPRTAVRIVDPAVQVEHFIEPLHEISSQADLEGAVEAAIAAGMLEVSDVGFDITGQRALLSFSFSCGMTCGHGGTALMERVDGRWVWSPRSCGSIRMS